VQNSWFIRKESSERQRYLDIASYEVTAFRLKFLLADVTKIEYRSQNASTKDTLRAAPETCISFYEETGEKDRWKSKRFVHNFAKCYRVTLSLLDIRQVHWILNADQNLVLL